MSSTKQLFARMWSHVLAKFDTMVGEKPVSEQINEAVDQIAPADIGAQPAGDYALKTEIPQSDWNESDPASASYVQNRTHYTDSGTIDCTGDLGVCGAVSKFISGNWRRVSLDVTQFYAFGVYTIGQIVDGELENLNCSVVKVDQVSYTSGIGSTHLGTYLKVTVDGDWIITIVLDGYDDYTPGTYVRADINDIQSFSWSYAKQLDAKYIPSTIARTADVAQSDWSVNDESDPAFVKNRTHWLERPYEPIVWDGSTEGRDSVDLSGLGIGVVYKISDKLFSLEELANVKVYATYNNVIYNGEVYQAVDGSQAFIGLHENFVFIGKYTTGYANNGEYVEVEHGELFVVNVAGDFTDSMGIVIPSAGIYASETLSVIELNNDTYHTIDKRFLPNSYATKEYVDNLITGAIGGSY